MWRCGRCNRSASVALSPYEATTRRGCDVLGGSMKNPRAFIPVFILQLTLGCQHARVQLSVSGLRASTGSQHDDPEVSPCELSLESLLQRVPKAGCEWRYDHATQTGIEDPVSADSGVGC